MSSHTCERTITCEVLISCEDKNRPCWRSCRRRCEDTHWALRSRFSRLTSWTSEVSRFSIICCTTTVGVRVCSTKVYLSIAIVIKCIKALSESSIFLSRIRRTGTACVCWEIYESISIIIDAVTTLIHFWCFGIICCTTTVGIWGTSCCSTRCANCW